MRVVEVDVSSAAYDEWHIDGAVLWNVYTDLKDPTTRPSTRPRWRNCWPARGSRPDSTVVFYGYAPALGFWLLKLLRPHRRPDPGLLPRGVAGRRATPGAPHAADAGGRALPARRAGLAAAGRPGRGPAHAIGDPGTTLLDVRSAPSTTANGSGPPAAWNRAAAPGTCRPRSTSPIDGLYDSRGAFRPPPSYGACSPRSTSTATAS